MNNKLIARFDDVDPERPSAALLKCVGLAIATGYRVQLNLLHAPKKRIHPKIIKLTRDGVELLDVRGLRSEICVSVLAWPGPRVRNELRIARELERHHKQRRITGLCFHADRVPLFVTEHLLRMFSLPN